MGNLKVSHKEMRVMQGQARNAICVCVQTVLDELEQATGLRVCGIDIHMIKLHHGSGIEYPYDDDGRDKYMCDRIDIEMTSGTRD